MKKTLVRFASFVTVALMAAACTIALPPIDMSSWFGDGPLTVTNGQSSFESTEPIDADEIPAFSRGGIGLSGFNLEGGSLSYLAPTQIASSPDQVRFEIFLSVDPIDTATDGDLLAAFTVDVDGNLQLVPSSLEITAGINNDVLTTALENGTFYAGFRVTILEDGTQVDDSWELTIDGLTASATLSLL